MKYIFLILCIQISYKECTIDIRLKDFVYLSDHLTAEECNLLYASLNFVSYELPHNLAVALDKIPHDIPCIKLLLRWNSGQEKWEGMRKTHMDIEHRLRQIGRTDLANWLGRAAFHNLATDMNNTLVNASYFAEVNKTEPDNLVTDKELQNYADEWTAIDSMLWVLIVGLLGTIVIAFCRIINIAYRRAAVNQRDGEELADLLSVASAESDIEETIYEFRVDKEVEIQNSLNDSCNIVKS